MDQLGKMNLMDLDERISSYRNALTLLPPSHPDRFCSLNNLACALHNRFKHICGLEDLDQAISFYQHALTLRPPGHPDRSGSLNNLALALSTRFNHLGMTEDMESAISFHRDILALHPPGHPDRSCSLHNLARALRTRFNQFGKTADLQEAISCNQDALTLRPPGHPDRSSSLNNLALDLYTRFNQFRMTVDLEQAILFHRDALAIRPPNHPDRSGSLNNLALALYTRFKEFDRTADLEEAISFHRNALAPFPPSYQDRSMSLHNLARALRTRFIKFRRTEDLKEAISLYRDALTFCPPGHPNHSGFLSSLAFALSTRFNQLDRMEDFEEAISFHRDALTLCPPSHPNQSRYLNNLADALCDRFDLSGRMEDLENAFTLYEDATTCSSSPPRDRLAAALAWAHKSRHHHPESIVQAYSTSFHLIEQCLIGLPSIASQQKFLATAQIPRSLASDAASAAISIGELEVAVELLDQSRAILWSKMEGYRYPLDRLRQASNTANTLAEQLESLSIQLENLAVSRSSQSGLLDSKDPMALVSLEVERQNHRTLLEDRKKVVEKIRNIEGFANFLKAVPFSTLRDAAAEGTVIMINISSYRCDSIILHMNKPPILVALPEVRREDLITLARRFAVAQDPRTDNRAAKSIFYQILADLWNDIVSPLCGQLALLGVPKKSRVWWCPTSELCALPLHAAGIYKRGHNDQQLPNLFTCSYIPTISALIRARDKMMDNSVSIPKLLVIGQPATLANVQDEIDQLQQLGREMKGEDFVKVIIGEEAGRERVLEELKQHSWAHFACHAHLGDNDQPFHASFELHAGSHLNLLDLMQARLPHAELAFLSACNSAAGGLTTPDETIHLAAALQFCGFRSVVGTLWAMEDGDGPIISREFYKHMFRNPGYKVDFRDSAEALNQAVQVLRRNNVPLERWIMFVHIGA